MNDRTDTPEYRYDAAFANTIEEKWQERWERDGTYFAPNPSGNCLLYTSDAADE